MKFLRNRWCNANDYTIPNRILKCCNDCMGHLLNGWLSPFTQLLSSRYWRDILIWNEWATFIDMNSILCDIVDMIHRRPYKRKMNKIMITRTTTTTTHLHTKHNTYCCSIGRQALIAHPLELSRWIGYWGYWRNLRFGDDIYSHVKREWTQIYVLFVSSASNFCASSLFLW